MFNLEPPQDDGLFITEDVGEWSKAKHYYLLRYIDAFTTAMKDKRWGSLHYIDLFAGAGIERIKETGELQWGSPMIAAKAPYPFTSLHLCEKDQRKFEALKARLSAFSNVQLLKGDANDEVSGIMKNIPDKSLSLAFLDPYGLHLDFETVKQLASRRVDLILFFPDRLDMIRNWRAYYYENNESNLDKFLGEGVDWRSTLLNAPRDKYADELLRLYERQLCSLGYMPFDPKRISVKERPLYRLLFCSKNKTGLKLWHNISLKEPSGQRTFDY
ncbi:MAG: three-Cys-motif partner protein TcmP [Planctomycetaceae bacterium]|nr:three-Cys-motif partner protein TcmP [Planctomycetaceae bacterium]